MVTMHDTLGLSTSLAVRISLLSAAVWWAGFTLVPYLGIRNRPAVGVVPEQGGLVRQSFGQLFATLRDLRNYPVTLTFLLAYLFYNDGIQTVIVSASTYGDKQLGFGTSTLIATILMVQFVAFAGALIFGKIAERVGSRRVILGGLGIWMLVVAAAYGLPAGEVVPFLALAVGIGLVMGGTQALSRSFFSLLIPRGREAEYFSLYQAAERGTSWLGTLVFGVVHQLTDSYRPAIFALVVFFVVGAGLLWRVNPDRGIAEAGNLAPAVV
jgi:UMF1 family MFS transporter